MINPKVKDYSEKLRKLGIEHEIIKHPSIKTVEEGLKYLGIEAADGVSTLIFKTEKGFVAVLRRDDHQLDLEKVKKILKAEEIKLASDQDILQGTGALKGATPLISGLPTIMDQTVLEREYVYGGTGSFEHDLKIKPADLKNVTKAESSDLIKTRRVFSGSRPTGRLHLGNYLGGVKGYIALQERGDFDCIYSVVDLHGITTPYNPKNLQNQIRDVVLDYLACGLDPSASSEQVPKCHLMIQSQVPEHVELAYLLGTIYPVSRMEQLPTYKSKKMENPDYINVGLFYYPILMAADILIYKAELVPVGIDQEPHLEVTREIARKFNSMFTPIFPEPKRFATPGENVPSLVGFGKMSKSVEGSYISLTDDLLTIRKKLAAAPTDSGKGERIPEEGGVANLLTLVELFEGKEEKEGLEGQYLGSGIKYSELKENLADAIYKELQPIQEKRKYFEAHLNEVAGILEEGRVYCSQIARQTLKEVKEAMGLGK